MDSEAFVLFQEAFIYELKTSNQNSEISKQLAWEKWLQLSDNERIKYQSMARCEQIARREEKKKLSFQINYCLTSENCVDEMKTISNILSQFENSTIEQCQVAGEFNQVSVFFLRNNGRPLILWHTLKDGNMNPENEKELFRRIQDFLK